MYRRYSNYYGYLDKGNYQDPICDFGYGYRYDRGRGNNPSYEREFWYEENQPKEEEEKELKDLFKSFVEMQKRINDGVLNQFELLNLRLELDRQDFDVRKQRLEWQLEELEERARGQQEEQVNAISTRWGYEYWDEETENKEEVEHEPTAPQSHSLQRNVISEPVSDFDSDFESDEEEWEDPVVQIYIATSESATSPPVQVHDTEIFQQFIVEEAEELEDFDPILKMELKEFEKNSTGMTFEKSDTDLDLLEIEYLMNNLGATFLVEIIPSEEEFKDSSAISPKELEGFAKSNRHMKHKKSNSSLGGQCHGISHDPFDLFSLTCQGKEDILQEFEDIGNDTSRSEFKTKEFNVSKCDNVCEFLKRRDDGLLFSEAREWHDAWVKRNKMLDVGKEAFLLGDHFGHESEEESVLFGKHVGKKDEKNLDLYISRKWGHIESS